jgi:hypothetical protein
LLLQYVVLWGLHESEQFDAPTQATAQLALEPLHMAVQVPVAAPQSTEQLALPLQVTLQSVPVQRK